MRVYLRTFGCRANRYDSEQVRLAAMGAGAELVEDPAEADVAVFNSCAVTAEAEVDLRKSIRGAARRNAALRSVVMGCAAALDRGALRALPTVEQVIPGGDVLAVAEAMGLDPGRLGDVAMAQTSTRALLRIQDGCDEHCTFCATTQARGANRSRLPDELVDEARALATHHPEIVLTGIHIGTWGRDIGSSLGALVTRLVREVPEVRFRLTSVEATEVDGELAAAFAMPDRLAPHLHAPLQSGADRVLRRMGRHWYTAAAYAAAVERLVAGHEAFALGADVIAGFPGETEAEHRATLALVRQLPFTYLHVFPFSARPGTAATRLSDPLPPPLVQERARELREVASELAARHRAARVGALADVIVVRGDRGEGLTGDYLTVSVAPDRLPRGTRFTGRLSLETGGLLATPV
ncbi:MAG TPA: MiaB/RimO family radical SAM methylthiotransferase, partial [Gemmatimonadaceae bacterium]|nr:MiaB/RimO family radical SAM methylthiotransferase [Gemmatimonadaceae bacterium]